MFPHWKANKLGEDVPTLDKHGIDLLQVRKLSPELSGPKLANLSRDFAADDGV